MSNTRKPDLRLWNYLFGHGGLDTQVLAEHQDSQRESWRQLGEILIREKMLTIKQVSTVLNLQLDEPDMRMGDLAIREGFMTQEQLYEALDIQMKSAPYPIAAMLEDERLDAEAIYEALSEYLQVLEGEAGSVTEASAS